MVIYCMAKYSDSSHPLLRLDEGVDAGRLERHLKVGPPAR